MGRLVGTGGGRLVQPARYIQPATMSNEAFQAEVAQREKSRKATNLVAFGAMTACVIPILWMLGAKLIGG